MSTNIVAFRRGTKEFIVQTVKYEGKSDVAVVFTTGAQSWSSSVKPSHKSRASTADDAAFLSSVVDALVTQDDGKYDFEVNESDDGVTLQVVIKVRVKEGSGATIPIKLCTLELKASEDHGATVRSMLSKLISRVKEVEDEQGKDRQAYHDLQKQLLAAQAATQQAVDAVKEQEAALLGNFVAVLNAKKEEIARLRLELTTAKEKLAAERARVASGGVVAAPPTSPPAAPRLAEADSDEESRPVGESKVDDGSETDPEYEDEVTPGKRAGILATAPHARPSMETLPVSSLGLQYEPMVRPVSKPKRNVPVPTPTPTPLPGPSVGTGSLSQSRGLASPVHVRPSASTVKPSTTDLIDAALDEDDDVLIAATARPRVIKPRTGSRGVKRGEPGVSSQGNDDDNTLPPESQLTVASGVSAPTSQKRPTRSNTVNSYE